MRRYQGEVLPWQTGPPSGLPVKLGVSWGRSEERLLRCSSGLGSGKCGLACTFLGLARGVLQPCFNLLFQSFVESVSASSHEIFLSALTCHWPELDYSGARHAFISILAWVSKQIATNYMHRQIRRQSSFVKYAVNLDKKPVCFHDSTPSAVFTGR